MKIVFVGTTGIRHTLVAANIYLDSFIKADYNNLPLWGDFDKEALGSPLFISDDKRGNRVYSLGVGPDVLMVVKTIEQLVKLLNCSERDLAVAPVFIKRERLLLFLHRASRSRLLNLLFLPVMEYFLQKEFAFISQQVEELKIRVGSAFGK